MTQDRTEIRKLAEARLLTHAQDDTAFDDLLRRDPRQALKEEFGVTVPASVKMRVIEEPADTMILVVPARTDESLSDAQLEQVAGGRRRRASSSSFYEALAKAWGEQLSRLE
jgi:hypothetical protein